ncbi:universal stress protein [uncultured Shimia sp.]|uniref:universal stress protein n=1 Tax=uncultured Shimia sp. TaxID=573152 RepID=UPI002605E42F|nr:universal stress protein [uncultured Shimia sp.]
MYKNILIPVASDHDPETERALDVARRLASDGATLTALTVVEMIPEYIATQLPEGQIEKNMKSIEGGLHSALDAAGDIKVEVVSGHSGRTILDWAEEHGVDCIVMASHRPDLSNYFLGSTASRVVRHAQCAVHVLR